MVGICYRHHAFRTQHSTQQQQHSAPPHTQSNPRTDHTDRTVAKPHPTRCEPGGRSCSVRQLGPSRIASSQEQSQPDRGQSRFPLGEHAWWCVKSQGDQKVDEGWETNHHHCITALGSACTAVWRQNPLFQMCSHATPSPFQLFWNLITQQLQHQ